MIKIHTFLSILNSPLECNNKNTLNYFKTIDSAKSSFHLKLKEAFHFKTKKPKLNVQYSFYSLYSFYRV